MATEYEYQPMILHGAEQVGFWASEYYCGKRIPAMNDRGDAVKVLEFVALPRGIVMRIDIDVDTRRVKSTQIVDIVGTQHLSTLHSFDHIGDVWHRDLRVWSRPGDSTSITFPHKEAKQA